MTLGNGSSKINKSSEMDSGENVYDLTSAGDAVRPIENSDGDTEDHDAGTLVSRLSEAPKREIRSRRETHDAAQEASNGR